MTEVKQPIGPRVTVVVPIYTAQAQGLKLLALTLSSLRAQSFQNWTALVIDDASPIDGISLVVGSMADSRFTYQRNPRNLHQAGNWNAGKQQVKTEFFCILHADDELKPTYLQTMVDALEARPDVAAAHCRAEIINEQGRVVRSFVDYVKTFLHPHDSAHTLAGEDGLSQLLRGNFIMCPTMFFRTQSVSELSFARDSLYIVDWEFWCQMMLHDLKIVGLPDNCFRYRRHGASATTESRKADLVFKEERDFMLRVRGAALSKGWHSAADHARKMRITQLRAAFFLTQDLVCLRLKDAVHKARFLWQVTKQSGALRLRQGR